MPLPAPEAGLVIRYEFLWSDEYEAGQEEGNKKRPCAIIVAAKSEQGGTVVIVAPITHSEPAADRGIEIPEKVRQALGLDNERQWVVLDELNEFVWPGYHIYPIDNTMPVRFDYGFLPPKMFELIRDKISDLDAKKKKVVNRDE